jgi:peptidoglycan/xylan/chitin deacetylase (PgdA/CDA1 family)
VGTSPRAVAKALYLGALDRLARRPFRLGTEPIISFTFDDFPRSAYSAGGAILTAFGARGTYYTAAALAGTTNELGEQFHLTDLPALVADGHELASHTLHHVSARTTPDFAHEILTGLQALGENGSGNFSYPFGEVTLSAKRAAGTHTSSARGTQPGINGPVADLNALRANRLYSDTIPLAHVEHLIATNTGWLIFYTHDVREHPSQYGCTPKYFEAAVKAASKSNARILTITDVLNGR